MQDNQQLHAGETNYNPSLKGIRIDKLRSNEAKARGNVRRWLLMGSGVGWV